MWEMGRYIKKCKGLAEIAVVELAEIDGVVRTREREMATVGKRIREVGDGELDLASGYVELRNTRRRVLIEATGSVSPLGASPSYAPGNSFEESNCAFDLSPLCLSKTSGDHVEYRGTISVPEAQSKSSQVETMTFYGGGGGRSNTPLAEGTTGMESTAGRPWMETISRGGSMVHEMPSESEIEDFFSAAEKDLQKRFSKKYNFDTIKGVPLEGRYEWIPSHHEWS